MSGMRAGEEGEGNGGPVHSVGHSHGARWALRMASGTICFNEPVFWGGFQDGTKFFACFYAEHI